MNDLITVISFLLMIGGGFLIGSMFSLWWVKQTKQGRVWYAKPWKEEQDGEPMCRQAS